IREGGVLHVVVEVVAVALDEQTGVVHGHRVGGADRDVAAVARGVQAHEALEPGLIEDRPVDRVEGGDAALMGEHDARGEGTDLGAIGCRRRLAARVGGAPAAVGGSAACGERERARAEEGDRTPLRDNGSHQLHGGSLSADENASQLGGDGPGAGAARPDLAGCGAWAGAARPGPAGRGQAGAVGDGLMAATAGDIATACRYSPTPDTSSRRTAPGHPRTAPPRPTPARTERAPRGTGAHGTGPRTVGDGAGVGGARPGGAQTLCGWAGLLLGS